MTSNPKRVVGKLITVFLLLLPFPAGYAGLQVQADEPDHVQLSQPLTLRWAFPSEETINLTPASDGVQIYLPLAGGGIVSLRAEDGQLLWRMEMGGEISASPVADEQAVYVASEMRLEKTKEMQAAGVLRSLGREGGITHWMRTLSKPIRGALAVSQTAVFGGASDGRVYALSKKNGEILWTVQLFSSFNSQIALSGSRLYLGGEDGTLFALEAATGKTLWRYRTRGGIRGRVAINAGTVFVGSADGYVYALNETNGRLRWRTRTGAAVQTVAIAGKGLLAASSDNFVYYFSQMRGAKLWKHQLGGRLPAQPVTAADGVLFIPLSSDAGVVLDLRDGRQLNLLPLGEEASIAAAPIVAGKLVLVTTRQGLRAFSRPAG